MPYNGSGVFQREFNWTQDAQNGIFIRADRFDSEHNGFAQGLSMAMTRDSQAPMLADLKMGNKKIINLADPVLDGDAVNKKWVSDNFLGGTSGGLFQFGDDLPLVSNFKTGQKTGWYRYGSGSLHAPAGLGGGAINFGRTGNSPETAVYGWLAMNLSGSTGQNMPRVYAAASSGTANDVGPWYELMHAGNFSNLMPSAIASEHSWSAAQTFGAGFTLPLSVGGSVGFAVSPVGASNQLHIRFGGTSPGSTGKLLISSVSASWLSFRPSDRVFEASGGVTFNPNLVLAGGVSGDVDFTGNIKTTQQIEADEAITTHGTFWVASNTSNRGILLSNLTQTSFNARLRQILADNSFQIGLFNGATSVGTLRIFTDGEIRQESGYLSQTSWGSIVASLRNDLSSHINLFGGTFGINVTAASLNIVVPSSGNTYFVNGGVIAARVEDAGGSLPSTYSVVTREKGDLRYLNASNMSDGTLPIARFGTSTSYINWVGERTSELLAGAIGSYAYAYYAPEIDTSFGQLRPASSLYPNGVDFPTTGPTLPGTQWMCCGRVTGSGNRAVTLWKRVS